MRRIRRKKVCLWVAKMNTEFVRIVADVELRDGVFATKEAVALRLEPLGKVRIVSVDDGKGRK